MKNIFGIILILACFSCNSSPISGTNEIYDTYLPSNSEAYDLQRNSLDVLHSYVDNNSALLARSSSGFYAGLLDTMSSWVSTQTNIDKDHINEVLSTTKNNINSKNLQQMGGVISQNNAYENNFSSEYETINSQFKTIQLRDFDPSSRDEVVDLMGTANQQLSITEYNHFVAKAQPYLTVHNQFESGQWEDIRDKYSDYVGNVYDSNGREIFSCFIAACCAIGAAVAEGVADAAIAAAIDAVADAIIDGAADAAADAIEEGIDEGVADAAEEGTEEVAEDVEEDAAEEDEEEEDEDEDEDEIGVEFINCPSGSYDPTGAPIDTGADIQDAVNYSYTVTESSFILSWKPIDSEEEEIVSYMYGFDESSSMTTQVLGIYTTPPILPTALELFPVTNLTNGDHTFRIMGISDAGNFTMIEGCDFHVHLGRGDDIEQFPITGLSASELSKGINNGEPIYSWQHAHYSAALGAISGYLALVETHLDKP